MSPEEHSRKFISVISVICLIFGLAGAAVVKVLPCTSTGFRAPLPGKQIAFTNHLTVPFVPLANQSNLAVRLPWKWSGMSISRVLAELRVLPGKLRKSMTTPLLPTRQPRVAAWNVPVFQPAARGTPLSQVAALKYSSKGENLISCARADGTASITNTLVNTIASENFLLHFRGLLLFHEARESTAAIYFQFSL